MIIGSRLFENGRTYICGILNLTPDSFSDGGRYMDRDAMLYHAEEMVRDGCDLLDLGAESTRPGYIPVPEEEEIERLIPAIEAIRARFDVPVSVDTYKAGTARAAIGAGADLINDIRGLHPDPEMLQVIARAEIPCILMHDGPADARVSDGRNGLPQSQQQSDIQAEMPEVLTPAQRVAKEMCEAAQLAQRCGIGRDQIILDPGIGFGKTQDQNLILIRDLRVMCESGYPVLLGASRKSVIGYALGLAVDEREEATMAASVLAAAAGCMFVRVHDVKKNRRAVDMVMAVLHV